jgi:hypothetical protein
MDDVTKLNSDRYEPELWSLRVTFAIHDKQKGEHLKDKDGRTRIFNAPRADFSWCFEVVELDMLAELDSENIKSFLEYPFTSKGLY